MYYRMWCSALVVLAVVVWSWVASSTQRQPAEPVQNTTCGSTQSCSPDDGHNDARNMLDRRLIINTRLVACC